LKNEEKFDKMDLLLALVFSSCTQFPQWVVVGDEKVIEDAVLATLLKPPLPVAPIFSPRTCCTPNSTGGEERPRPQAAIFIVVILLRPLLEENGQNDDHQQQNENNEHQQGKEKEEHRGDGQVGGSFHKASSPSHSQKMVKM
jgi:hypothetical protein